MRRDGAEQVVEAPHFVGKVWLGQDPAAAQAAEAVDFGEAVGDDEFRSKVERGSRRVFVNGVQVDLIHQDMCAYTASDVAYLTKRGVRRQDAAGIVQVGDDDQFCFGADGLADRGRIEGVAFAFRRAKVLTSAPKYLAVETSSS